MSAAPDYDAPACRLRHEETIAAHIAGETEATVYDLACLDQILTRMATDVPAHLDAQPDVEAACLLLFDVRETRKRLAALESYIEAEAAKRMPGKVHRFAGWVAERRGGSAWKDWRHDDVAWAVTRPIAIDPDTGEVVPEVAQIVDRVRSALLNAARMEWRTTALREVGVDPANHAHREPSRRTVDVRPDVEDVTE